MRPLNLNLISKHKQPPVMIKKSLSEQLTKKEIVC